MLRLEPRAEPSRVMAHLSPVLALLLTSLAGAGLFAALGKDPVRAMDLIFLEPLRSLRGISELLMKATPLILMGIGLAIGFRAGVWNIGAEGQLIAGALAGGAVALAVYPDGGIALLPAMCGAGIIGGMAWAAIPALLKTRYNASEILVSLMMVYVAGLLLNAAVHGLLKNPQGFNFPESRLFQSSALLPPLIPGTRTHVGLVVALIVALAASLLLTRHIVGFQVKVMGQAPAAANFAGFSVNRITWGTLLLSGGLSGLAGVFEAAGPVGQLVPGLSVGYGFTAIIVAFLGRLEPLGIVLAGLLMALTYIGGETAQIGMRLPSATTGVFQGMLLFFLLATDVLITHRLAPGRGRRAPQAIAAGAPAP